MTNQRVRYARTGAGILTSRRNFPTSAGTEVIVQLDLNAKKYRILDATSLTEIAVGGNTRNVSVLKIQAKKGLMGLGVQFTDETRVREINKTDTPSLG